MSIHRSLKGVDTLRGERSVLTRFERIQKLTKDGKLKPEEASAYNLPKVRTKFKTMKVKKVKAEGAETAAVATPAEPAKAEKGKAGDKAKGGDAGKSDKGKSAR